MIAPAPPIALDDLIELWELLAINGEGNVVVARGIAMATREHLVRLAEIGEAIDGILERINRK